jgi:hypothetical protein
MTDEPVADPLDRQWLFDQLRALTEENERLAEQNLWLGRELFHSRYSNKALAEQYRRWADQLDSLPGERP